MKVYLTQDPSITHRKHRTRSLNLQGGVCKSEIKTLAPAKSGINVNSNNVINKPAEISFSGLSSVQKPVGKMMGKFLEMAANNEAVFNAFFAIGLTCFLRPAAIMSLPGKKNKDDKKYASAHSIASGVIGYLISLAIFNPISTGVKKIVANPEKFLKKGSEYLMENGKLVEKSWAATSKMLKMLPETILALPRAIVTVALIPPILKYVFGMEKKSHSKDMHPILDNYAAINFKSSKSKEHFQSFMGGKK